MKAQIMLRTLTTLRSGWKWTVRVLMRRIKRAPRRLDTSHSVCFTRCSQVLQCTGQHVQRSVSVKVTQTMQHAARRLTARLLYRGRCSLHIVRYRDMKCHDILARWATI